jgi:hypothetical protein
LEGVVNIPEKLSLQYARAGASPQIWTNITTLGGGETTFMFSPSGLSEGKDYFLKIVDAFSLVPVLDGLQPFYSGKFAVYSPIELTNANDLPPASPARRAKACGMIALVVLFATCLTF